MPDPVVKAKYFKHNDNYDDVGKISLEKVAALGNLPYLIAETPTLPAYKKDKKHAAISYTNPADDSLSFTAADAFPILPQAFILGAIPKDTIILSISFAFINFINAFSPAF